MLSKFGKNPRLFLAWINHLKLHPDVPSHFSDILYEMPLLFADCSSPSSAEQQNVPFSKEEFKGI